MPKHKMILSTTEPNNNIPLIRIIQDDKNSQIFEAEIVEEGQLLDFDNKVVFFNAQIGPYKVRDKVESVDYANSRVSYTLIDAFLQKVGEFEGWFSFADSEKPESDLFSTMCFNYRVLPGIRKNIWEGNYFWDLQELVEYYKRYKTLIAGIVENKDFSGLIDKISEIDGRTNRLDNFATATKTEAEQGMAANKFMTPQRVAQQTDARLATNEEAQEGTNNKKLMTPQSVAHSIREMAVTTSGDQDVEGNKNFLEVPKYNGKSLIPISSNLYIDSGFKNYTTGWVRMERYGELIIIHYSLSPKNNSGTWMTIIDYNTILPEYRLAGQAYSSGGIGSSEIADASCVVGMNEQGLQFASWNRPSGVAPFTGQIIGIALNK
ncbi:BppU family phage baseplate upper protein [Enterococcus faecium]|uniref:BppU family phage baseplate upper protein n=1 Tax=Enterococcus faecium TaxID=1352 RepID=UPI001EE8BC11|nr:BppU family phage baseplate upper protein [Enterococcus faecium]